MRASVRLSRASRVAAAIAAAALVTACGGGGGGAASGGAGGPDGGGDGPGAGAEPPAGLGPQGGMRALVAAAPVRVNPAGAGAHRLLALGTSAGDGLGVAWTDDASRVVLQRFDRADNRVGGEVVMTPSSAVQPVDLATASAGVLANGDVVLAYNVPRPPGAAFEAAVPGVGVYVQRFSAAGALLTPETPVLPSRFIGDQRVWSGYHRVQAVVLSNDDWLVTAEGANYIGSERRRLNNQAAPIGGVADMPAGIWAPRFSYAADAHGGFTANMAESRFTGRSDISGDGNFYDVTYYDASETPRSMAQGQGFSGSSSPVAAPGALLRLQGGFALVMREWGTLGAGRPYAASLRLIGSDGQTESARVGLPFVPQQGEVRLLELVDGTFVVGVPATGGPWTLQRFDRTGTPVGGLLSASTGGAVPLMRALGGGGLVLGWTAPGTAGSDVFTQRFVPSAQ